jgi:hypothetical protein
MTRLERTFAILTAVFAFVDRMPPSTRNALTRLGLFSWRWLTKVARLLVRRRAAHAPRPQVLRGYELLKLLGDGPKTRNVLMRCLKVGQTTFYRDLQLIRKHGVRVVREGRCYRLDGRADLAIARFKKNVGRGR